MNYLFGILILFACCALGSTQGSNNTTSLSCYLCSPLTHSAVACADPFRNNVPLVNCSSIASGNISTWSFSCHSSFLNYQNVSGNGVSRSNETGIYRGCVTFPSTSVDTHCFQTPGINITLVSCQTCTLSGCNRHTFNSGGGITGNRPGGATTTIPSIFVLSLCGIFMYFKLYLDRL